MLKAKSGNIDVKFCIKNSEHMLLLIAKLSIMKRFLLTSTSSTYTLKKIYKWTNFNFYERPNQCIDFAFRVQDEHFRQKNICSVHILKIEFVDSKVEATTPKQQQQKHAVNQSIESTTKKCF